MRISYVGYRQPDGRCQVSVEEDTGRGITSQTTLDPKPSQRLFNHSPDGFEWGYGGSGPAQLALAILLDACKRGPFAASSLDLERSMNFMAKDAAEKIPLRAYQDFKSEFIARCSRDGFRISLDSVREFLSRRAAAVDAQG